jgi:hypothetical protein
MSESTANNLMNNEYVKETLKILQENGKDISGLAAIINQLKEMENFVSSAERQIYDMKTQLDEMREAQNHPIRTALQNTIKSLEKMVAEIKNKISEIKTNIVEGCKNVISAFKETGASILDKLASFFRVKSSLQAIKNNTIKITDNCDRALARIDTFSKEYHQTGLHLKNMVRVVTGKEPLYKAKESGKLAKAVGAPYRAQKSCMKSIRNQCNKMIAALDKLEQAVNAKNAERISVAKKPTLMERLEAKKKEIKALELEKPPVERGLKRQEATV